MGIKMFDNNLINTATNGCLESSISQPLDIKRRLLSVSIFILTNTIALSIMILTNAIVARGSDVDWDVNQSTNLLPAYDASPNSHLEVRTGTLQKADEEFDVSFVEEYLDYVFLVEDRLNVSEFHMNTLILLDNGEFEIAISRVKEKIQEFLSDDQAPWNIEKPMGWKSDKGIPYIYLGYPLSKYLQLLALGYELNGDYYEANKLYDVVYGANEKALAWTNARILYEKNQYDSSFSTICFIIQRHYALSNLDIDSVVEKVRLTEHRKVGDNVVSNKMLGFPVDLNDGKSIDIESQEAYRLRDWCARFTYPNLVYKGRTSLNANAKERVATVALIREGYNQFLDFMESEYEKAMRDGDERNLSFNLWDCSKETKEQFTRSMEILRKIKDLPY